MKRYASSGCFRSETVLPLRQLLGAWCRGDVALWQAQANINWDTLIEQARRHEVAGLLYTLLPEEAPTDVREALRRDYRTQLAGNTLYMQHLAKIVPALQGAGVRFAVVKGAALIATTYTDWAQRSMEDIDLLVHPEDTPQLRSVMNHLGWQEEDNDIAGAHFGERYRAETSFVCREGEVLLRVEGHLDLPGFYPPARPAVWQQVTTVSAAGIGKLPVLHLSTHLSYLCTHLYYHHCGQGLKWLVDIALLVSRVPCWHDVVVDAYQYGTTRPLHLALHDVAKYLGIPVPQHIVETLRFLPMPISLRLLLELCKRPALHYWGIRLLDLYRAPSWSIRFGYLWRKVAAPRWKRRTLQQE
ncbi:MAG: nucleotidyltransferase family protein [Armatimonadota bacterium]|nr:nucleotidyltransferase family protein [Chloracidobacterium sp.]MDW8104714.1 nucleotidyltransferase family protein [Armatimonadota bacterium]MDW8289502.1 nucleotidyltransferase family protein [Armatimonadota bacterium]